MKLGDALRDRAGLNVERIESTCDDCGAEVYASEFGARLGKHYNRKPFVRCHECTERRREKEFESVQQKTRADIVCWKAFKDDWRGAYGDEEKQHAAYKALLARVYQKAEYAELAKEWIRDEKAGLHKRNEGRRGSARKAGF